MLYSTLLIRRHCAGARRQLRATVDIQYLMPLLYLAIFGSVIAFGAYFTLVGRIEYSKAAYSTLLFPLVALRCQHCMKDTSALTRLLDLLIFTGKSGDVCPDQKRWGKLLYRRRKSKKTHHPDGAFIDFIGFCSHQTWEASGRHVISNSSTFPERHRRWLSLFRSLPLTLTYNFTHRFIGRCINQLTPRNRGWYPWYGDPSPFAFLQPSSATGTTSLELQSFFAGRNTR